MTPATSESGMAVRLMSVVRKFHRNRKSTTVTMTAALEQCRLDVADRPPDEVGLLERLRVDRDVARKAWPEAGRASPRSGRVTSSVLRVRLLLDGRHHRRAAR